MRHYLHSLRKQFGLNQEEAAAQTGYSKGTINAWERGYLAPDFIELAEWASIFGMRLALVPDEKPSGQASLRKRECLAEQETIAQVTVRACA